MLQLEKYLGNEELTAIILSVPTHERVYPWAAPFSDLMRSKIETLRWHSDRANCSTDHLIRDHSGVSSKCRPLNSDFNFACHYGNNPQLQHIINQTYHPAQASRTGWGVRLTCYMTVSCVRIRLSQTAIPRYWWIPVFKLSTKRCFHDDPKAGHIIFHETQKSVGREFSGFVSVVISISMSPPTLSVSAAKILFNVPWNP